MDGSKRDRRRRASYTRGKLEPPRAAKAVTQARRGTSESLECGEASKLQAMPQVYEHGTECEAVGSDQIRAAGTPA